MRDWIALARPRQWSKNLLLYAAYLFTAGDEWGIGDDGETVSFFLRASLGFVAFCFLSSAGYLLNDARDAALDRAHPRKRHRPVAAGRISPAQARLGALGTAAGGLTVGAPLGVAFALAALSYLGGTTAYTLGLKRVPLVDVAVVASLFALRALAGAFAIGVEASPWIVICTFSGAAFVAAVKRQQERWLMGAEVARHRASIGGGVDWPRYVAGVAAIVTVVGYTLYALTAANLPEGGEMVLTVPFVVLALGRYWQVARAKPDRDADEIAFRDPAVLFLVIGFLVAAVGIAMR